MSKSYRWNWLPRAKAQWMTLRSQLQELDGKFYPGAGFHYSLWEKHESIGEVLDRLPDHPFQCWDTDRAMGALALIAKIKLEFLETSVSKAEAHVRKGKK